MCMQIKQTQASGKHHPKLQTVTKPQTQTTTPSRKNREHALQSQIKIVRLQQTYREKENKIKQPTHKQKSRKQCINKVNSRDTAHI